MRILALIYCIVLCIQISIALPEVTYDMNALSQNSSCTTDCCKTLPQRGPMTYYFYQNTGRFLGGSGQYFIDTLGYSGQGQGYLNPLWQCKIDGPLPATTYKLTYCKNTMHNPPVQRPCSFYLDPQRPQQMCGMDDYFIHGCQCCTSNDDTEPPVNGCSAGCIVINYENRRKIRVGDIIIVRQYQTWTQNKE